MPTNGFNKRMQNKKHPTKENQKCLDPITQQSTLILCKYFKDAIILGAVTS